ncbi:unnamed protein product, partial [Rotaria sp. Silwood1]
HLNQQSNIYIPTTDTKLVALILTEVLRDGFLFHLPWCDDFLEIIANDIKTSYSYLIDLLDKNLLNQYNEQLILNFLNDHKNSILFSRTLLISLLFKEIPFPCARITEKFSLIHYFSILIYRTTNYLIKFNEKKTPTWLTSAFIFIDLYEKISVASRRYSIINQNYRDYKRIWQWFDERTLQWYNYSEVHNK